jgi:hypothetical protein
MARRQDDPRQLFFCEIESIVGSHADGKQRTLDVNFMLRSFCVSGLPHRRPKTPMQEFSRHDDFFALTVHPKRIRLPGGQECEIGVPFGPKSRLLMVWAATQAKDPARRPNDRDLEIGPIEPWLRSIGIRADYGDALTATKDQLVRLSFTDFTLVEVSSEGTIFEGDRLIEGGAFLHDDLHLYADGKWGRMRWPDFLRLSEKAFRTFRDDAIPIPPSRLAKVSHSAMAIDIFLFLCHRCPMLSPGESQRVTWRQLVRQFGSSESPAKFRDAFTPSIQAALRAYPEAQVVVDDREGLILHYSDPADLRRPFMVVQVPDALEPTARKRRRSKAVKRPAA